MTLSVGVIGMGWMGAVHSRCYQAVPDRFEESTVRARLVICADALEARARHARDRFGFAHHTTRWQEVIADPQVEAVSITTPNALHREIACAAARARKHIFCEKPVGRSPRDTAEIERAAREAGVTTFTGYNYRWAPVVQYARQLITEGRLGKLTHYRGRFFVGYASNPQGVLSWRFDREQAGWGALGDLMSHVVDMALMLAGPIRRVIGNRETFIRQRPLPRPGEGTHFSVGGEGPLGDVTNEDYVGALAQFENGAHGTLEVCRTIQGHKCQMAFEVNGTQGALRWDFERMNELHVFAPDRDGRHDGYTKILTSPEHPFHAHFNPGPAVCLGYEDLKVIEAHEFLMSIARPSADRQREPSFANALRVAEVLAAVECSWASEKWETVGKIEI